MKFECRDIENHYCKCDGCKKAQKHARYLRTYKPSKVKRYENALKNKNFQAIEKEIRCLRNNSGKLSDELMKEMV